MSGKELRLPVLIATTALMASLVLYAVWPDWRGHYEPLHAAMEAVGALAAVAMARVLFQRDQGTDGKYQALALGFLSMGILQGFHAIAPQPNAFILLRGLASLAGGLGFAAVFLLPRKGRWLGSKQMFWCIAAASVIFGLMSVLFADNLPEMLRNGEFSPTAVAPKALAGFLFFGAAVGFFITYGRSHNSDDYLFGCLSLLFALSELMFNYSRFWDSVWWLWHVVLLSAYLWVLAYLSRDYLQTIGSMRTALLQTKHAEAALRESEQLLRTALDERERIARDLHDGIIQSIYAIGLNLNRCRRLMGEPSHPAAHQLTEAIDDLNVVIRDVRNYIAGLEPRVSSPEELETSLAAIVRMMSTEHAPSFKLSVDPQAARRLTSEQALHMLYIAREAMSNSLRHAGAKSGMIALESGNHHVRLRVEDDGVGFDPSLCRDQGQGLRNIVARSQKLGARCDIMSSSGKGTQVIVDIPVDVLIGNNNAAT